MSKPKKVIGFTSDSFIEIYGVAKDNSHPFLRICIGKETIAVEGENLENLMQGFIQVLGFPGRRSSIVPQIIKENNANGIKDIYWDEKEGRWVIAYLGKGLKPAYYKNFTDLIESLKPEEGH